MGIFSGSAKRLEKERIDQTGKQFADLGTRSLTGVVPIADVKWREKVKVAGRVKALRVQPWADQVASSSVVAPWVASTSVLISLSKA